MIRIVLADDHSIMRSGLRALLHQQPDFEVVGEANDGREALDLVESLRPDVAVLDITMPNLNGIDAARQMAAKQLGVAIIVLSMHSDEGYVLRAMKAGVHGYLLKESAEIDLLHAIRAVNKGHVFFSRDGRSMFLEHWCGHLNGM